MYDAVCSKALQVHSKSRRKTRKDLIDRLPGESWLSCSPQFFYSSTCCGREPVDCVTQPIVSKHGVEIRQSNTRHTKTLRAFATWMPKFGRFLFPTTDTEYRPVSLQQISVLFITSGQSSLTKGRIATAHGRYSIYFPMGRPSPSKLPLPIGIWVLDLHLIHGSLGPPESRPKRHLDRFSLFFQGSRSWQTERDTDRPCYSVCNNRPHLRRWINVNYLRTDT